MSMFLLMADVPPEQRDWRGAALREAATSLPNCTVVEDPGGRIAALFGAATSGLAALYDSGGRLIYWGGVTGARGMRGDNPSAQSLLAAIRNPLDPQRRPVLGCPLQDRPRSVRE